ncbi:TraA family conjugative transfer protein (plasmid) [Burkholderia aenigmatica]|uniref:TraA family conjugative transfer protein n=1 Tax=Burkholderia aenigmatica TaxID=2015348 RepID=UPI003B432EC2
MKTKLLAFAVRSCASRATALYSKAAAAIARKRDELEQPMLRDDGAIAMAGFSPFALASVVAFSLLLVFMSSAAMAGTDTTFNAIVTMVQGWLTGSLGQVLALVGFAIALGAGLVRGSIMGVAIGLGLALSATYGPTVLTGLFTATF